MSRRPIKNAVRTIVVGSTFAILLAVGFLAKEYEDDILLLRGNERLGAEPIRSNQALDRYGTRPFTALATAS